MTLDDQCVSIHPYFRVPAEREQEVMELCKQFVDRSSREDLCLYYGFSKAEEILHCRFCFFGNIQNLLQAICPPDIRAIISVAFTLSGLGKQEKGREKQSI